MENKTIYTTAQKMKFPIKDFFHKEILVIKKFLATDSSGFGHIY